MDYRNASQGEILHARRFRDLPHGRQWGYGPDDALSWPEPIRRKRDGSVDCEGYLDDFIGCDGFGMVDIGKVARVGDVRLASGRVVASRWTVEVG